MIRRALFALLLLAGCPKPTRAPQPPDVPPEPMGAEPDRDEDGVADSLDACPDVAGSDNGCPSVKTGDDRDGDGINNDVDKCPDDPEDKDAFQDDDGCPDPDNDRDGVLDRDDKCPSDAEDKDGFEDYDGCPDPDNDHDGVLDRDDKCPGMKETVNGFQDDDGCPDVGTIDYQPGNSWGSDRGQKPPPPKPRPKKPADRDGDGIIDDKDRCPDEPETINGKKDGDGCPD